MDSQTKRLIEVLSDYAPHSNVSLLKDVYGAEHLGIARLGARVFEAKSMGNEIRGFWGEENGKRRYFYQMTRPQLPKVLSFHKPDPVQQPML